jgi:hypothetical protein
MDSCGRKSKALTSKWQLSSKNTNKSSVVFCQHSLDEQISDLHHEEEENRVGKKELEGNASE